MPEVVRGSRASFQVDRPPQQTAEDGQAPSTPVREPRNVHFGPESPDLEREETPTPGLRATDTGLSTMSATERRKSREQARKERKSEPERDAYYDSRAATKREFRRRASTLQEYYAQNPTLLPQLPFTWRHGWKRWKLFFTIFLIIVDACVIPIVLYYTMKFAGHVQGFISEISWTLSPRALADSVPSLCRCGHHMGRTNICRIRGSQLAALEEGELFPATGIQQQMGV
jgi:hypothetical protein